MEFLQYLKKAEKIFNELGYDYDQKLFDELKYLDRQYVAEQHELLKVNSLPDIYSGELNTQRIKKYISISENYIIDKGIVRDIFCKGADWYKEKCQTAVEAVTPINTNANGA